MLSKSEAEDFLYREAELIDQRDFDAWLALFTDDAIYWAPNVVEDPSREPSILYDNRQRLEERVYRLTETPAHAQIPPSRTIRTVNNVQVGAGSGDNDSRVFCNTIIYEMRLGDSRQVGLGDPRWVAGRCEYLLRPDEDGWRIAMKKVSLLQRELPLYNLTFII